MQNHERRAVLLPSKHRTFLVAWAPGTDSSEVLEKTKKLVTSWHLWLPSVRKTAAQ